MNLNQSVSIVIPSYNAKSIDAVVSSLLSQSALSAISEILVVGNSLPTIKSSLVKSHYVEEKNHPSVLRNIGICHASSEYTIFIDSDCIPVTNWLKNLLEASSNGFDIVSGSMQLHSNSILATAHNISLFHEFCTLQKSEKKLYLPSFSLLLKKTLFDSVGLFNEKLEKSEDLDWTLRASRAGHDLYFCSSASVFHEQEHKNFLQFCVTHIQTGKCARLVRLQNKDRMLGSKLIQTPILVPLLAPIIAFVRTIQILLRVPSIFLKEFFSIIFVYISKICWCAGVFLGRNAKLDS